MKSKVGRLISDKGRPCAKRRNPRMRYEPARTPVFSKPRRRTRARAIMDITTCVPTIISHFTRSVPRQE